MKASDIQKIFDAGLITEDQRIRIIEHFGLDRTRNLFLAVLVAFGSALALLGVILVISANWHEIPRLMKISAGALLMAGAHATGWRLSRKQSYPKVAEALHFFGAGLFLANIALIGQVYNLSSRPSNAFLLWLAGITPLAWLLRSRLIHLLSLAGLLTWFGTEINSVDGWLHFAAHECQMGLFAGLGLLMYGVGSALETTQFASFGRDTQKVGLPILLVGLLVTLFGFSHDTHNPMLLSCFVAALAVPGLLLLAHTLRTAEISRPWDKIWLSTLAAWIVFVLVWCLMDIPRSYFGSRHFEPFSLIACIVIIAGALVQLRVAIEMRSAWMVNLGILLIGLTVTIEFFQLFGSMMHTGLIFLVGGVGLLVLGYVLERRRRAVIQQMNSQRI